MKKTLLTTIIAAILMITGAQHACAGFVLAKNVHTETANHPVDTKLEARAQKHALIAEIKSKLKSTFSSDHKADGKRKKSAWQAITSFACSLVGFICIIVGFSAVAVGTGTTVIGGAAIPAIILGILCGTAGIIFGVKGRPSRRHKFIGLALAGIILGSIDVAFLFALALIVAAFG